MPTIPFTQFLRPSGKTKDTWIEMSDEVELLARRFIEAGGSYTSEMLHDGEVSLCAVFKPDPDDLEPTDIACVIAMNGPDIPDAVEQLIRESFDYLQKIKMRGVDSTP